MDNIKRGEIFYITRGKSETCGSEQQSDRPGIVVSNDLNNANSSTVEVVYLTTQPKTELPTHCIVYSTGRASTVLCEQIHTVAVERIQKYIGQCSEKEMEDIDAAIAISLGLHNNNKTTKKYSETIQSQQAEIDALKEQLETYAEKEKCSVPEQNKSADNSLQMDKKLHEDLIRTAAERDTYKTLFEKLLAQTTSAKN